MAKISAPRIFEPLYECASVIVVSGYIPGAMIDLFAIPVGASLPVRIGGGISYSATGQVFGVDKKKMIANTKLSATQSFGSVTSPHSPEVILQRAITIGSPRLTAPLIECASCVRVNGVLPGSSVAVPRQGLPYWKH